MKDFSAVIEEAQKTLANDNIELDKSGLWMVCGCGSHLFGVRQDEKTGRNHIICERCLADKTMSVFEP